MKRREEKSWTLISYLFLRSQRLVFRLIQRMFWLCSLKKNINTLLRTNIRPNWKLRRKRWKLKILMTLCRDNTTLVSLIIKFSKFLKWAMQTNALQRRKKWPKKETRMGDSAYLALTSFWNNLFCQKYKKPRIHKESIKFDNKKITYI